MINNNEITWEETEDPWALQSNETHYKEFSRDPVRTPMQWDDSSFGGFCESCNKTWLPVQANYTQINVKNQLNDTKSTLALYKNLIQLKKDKEVLKLGGVETKVLGDQVFAFQRTYKDRPTIAVLINIGTKKTINLGDLFDEADKSSKTKATVLISNSKSELQKGAVISNINSISLGDYDAVVFEMSSAMTLAKGAFYVVAAFWVVFKFVL